MSCCEHRTLQVDAEIPVEVEALFDPETLESVADAVVTVRILDSEDIEIGGVSWPIALVYNAEEDSYEGDIPATAELIANQEYQLVFTATATENRKAEWIQLAYAEEKAA